MRTLLLVFLVGGCAAEALPEESQVEETTQALSAGHDGIPDKACNVYSLAQAFRDGIAGHFNRGCGNPILGPGTEFNFWCETKNEDYSFRLYDPYGPALWQSNPPRDAGFKIQAYRGLPGQRLEFWGSPGACNCASNILCRTQGLIWPQ